VSGLAVAGTVRSRWSAYLAIPFAMPAILTIGSYTVLRSVSWRKKGIVSWKGRTYPG